jgi:phosphinothricin acetyltransferase
MIRAVKSEDGEAICSIYNHYIEKTVITFEERPLEISEMDERIRKISGKYPYLVWEEADGAINGYAYANAWRERSAYRYSAELSIYLRDGFQGRGMGRKLMKSLIEEVRKTDIHSLVAGIALPNERSVALHEKFGFKKTAHLEEVGFKFGNWLDVGYWQLRLN